VNLKKGKDKVKKLIWMGKRNEGTMEMSVVAPRNVPCCFILTNIYFNYKQQKNTITVTVCQQNSILPEQGKQQLIINYG